MGYIVKNPEGECEFCGRPFPTEEERETMAANDTRVNELCWSRPDDAVFCEKDPSRPGAPHPRDCRCGDCCVDQD